ncbi:hypothetical protein D9758_017069 [Tetrapyrgos nigripes]|uniref:Uncharacterized protein n=1 Tax=Tetrapyrgos nigripes TaxID=182062 RepID=A0A8H5CFL5_9AGAR|nr:hypothetical protein D9758_017069 [Tetrapyrgos nigripes]
MGERWSVEDTWQLITEIRKKSNFQVLFGPEVGENTSGDSKAIVLKGIGEVLFPEAYQTNQKRAGDRVKHRIDYLRKNFKECARCLKKTGEGVQGLYQIAPDGPDHDTDRRAVNIWEEIECEFVYFPELWKMWSTKPNLLPICVTTAVGPHGLETVLVQSFNTPYPPPPPGSAPYQSPRAVLGFANTANDASQAVGNGNSDPSATATPPSTPTPSGADKENMSISSTCRHPRPSSFSASGSIQQTWVLLPQKRGFEEQLMDMSKDMMDKTNRRADDMHQAKKRKYHRLERQQLLEERKLLLEEYKAQAYTLKEYQEKLQELNSNIAVLDGKKLVRAPSPDWDQSLLEKDQEGTEL